MAQPNITFLLVYVNFSIVPLCDIVFIQSCLFPIWMLVVLSYLHIRVLFICLFVFVGPSYFFLRQNSAVFFFFVNCLSNTLCLNNIRRYVYKYICYILLPTSVFILAYMCVYGCQYGTAIIASVIPAFFLCNIFVHIVL